MRQPFVQAYADEVMRDASSIAAHSCASPHALSWLGRSCEGQEEAEGVLAQLQLRTVAYCWQHLSDNEWAMLMHRAHESIAATAVLYEDQVGHMRICRFCRLSAAPEELTNLPFKTLSLFASAS